MIDSTRLKKYQNNVNTIVFQDFMINLSPYKSVLLVITDNLEEFGQLCCFKLNF